MHLTKTASARDLADKSLYTPLPFFVVRRPLCPLRIYRASRQIISSSGHTNAPGVSWPALCRGWVDFALAVGSHVYVEQSSIQRRAGTTTAHVNRTLFRYLNRMSTRPTPYGSFAAVALGKWSGASNLEFGDSDLQTRSRFDMGWLLEFCMTLQWRPDVLPFLKVVVNPALLNRGHRLFLGPGLAGPQSATPNGLSIRATNVVNAVQKLASAPIPHQLLLRQLCESFPDAAAQKFEDLLQKLVHNGVLLTDLVPPLTGANPVRHVIDRLCMIPACAALSSELEAVCSLLVDLDREEPAAKTPVYYQVIENLRSIHRPKNDSYVQVDMSLRTASLQMQAAVGRQAAVAAELLLRSCRFPTGPAHLADFRRQFLHLYGDHREVRLLEALDPQFGLDFSKSWSAQATRVADFGGSRRALVDLACEALRTGQREVALSARDVDTFFPPLDRRSAPSSLDLFISLAAKSERAVESQDFNIIVGPRCGEVGAGKSLARFADMLGSDAERALAMAIAAEERDREIAVELDYLPTRLRSANVAVRPAVLPKRISLGCANSEQIPLREIVVGVEADRFYMRWIRSGERIRVTSLHMLNGMNDPPLVQFLLAASNDGICQLQSFHWGLGESLTCTPRLRVGRIILAPATWRINVGSNLHSFAVKSDYEFFEEMRRWRAIWNVPRYVYLTEGDNRLLLDLDDEYEVEEIRLRLSKLRERSNEHTVLIQEMLPDFESGWFGNGEDLFSCELVVSLALNLPCSDAERRPRDRDRTVAQKIETARLIRPGRVDVQPESELVYNPSSRVPHELGYESDSALFQQTFREPGSDWLYCKVYCPECFHDDIISGPLLNFANTVSEQGLIDDWFFLRYSDPDLHIRVRFHGDPAVLTSSLYPTVCEWAQRLLQQQLLTRLCIDTYDREIETFGGASALLAVERFFTFDSRTSALLLRECRRISHELGVTLLAMLCADDLFNGFKIDYVDRRPSEEWRKECGQWAGQQFRQHKTVVRALLMGNNGPGSAELCSTIRSILAMRREAIDTCYKGLDGLRGQRALSRPMDQIVWKLVHLHCNRLLGLNRDSEARVLWLLHRTRKSLLEYP